MTKSRPTMGAILWLIAYITLLPYAAPFASGSSPILVSPPPPITRTPTARYMASTTTTSTGAVADKKPRRNQWWRRPRTPIRGGEEAAGWLSRLVFGYATPLLKASGQRRLDADDAYFLPTNRRMSSTVDRLSSIYHRLRDEARPQLEHERASGDPSNTEAWLLAKALVVDQKQVLVFTGLLRLLNTAVQAFPALLVARLLRLVEAGSAQPPAKALVAAITLVVVLSIKMVIENQFFHAVVKTSTEVRGNLAGLVFDKSLRLPAGGAGVAQPESSEALGVGGVLNLMQSDASIVESAALQFHTIWDGPLQIAMYTFLLLRYLGPSVFWGIGVLLMTIPVNSITLRILNRLSKYENEAKDARTKRTTESISNMKLLKLQGWEERFAEDVRASRHEELRRHVARGVVRALNTAFSNAVPALVLVVTLTAYVKTGKPIVASTIFTAISLFNQLRFPLFFYPMLIDSLANGRNAMRRMSSYLSAEEIVPYVEHRPPSRGGGSISLTNGNFLWSARSHTLAPALLDAEVTVRAGEVAAVVGGVGSGKSALIKALLGELNPAPRTIVQQAVAPTNEDCNQTTSLTKPTVVAEGNVAYCSQEAWLPKGTIRDAILFGREYDEERYYAAIYDAGLDNDIMDNADAKQASGNGALSHDTDVGEGGSSLSGGQRARVALARALYSGEDTKVFLLDDCLAALDASVGSTVFERLTRRLRGSNSAAILVTNDPSIPRRCDRVILMGKVPSSSSCSTIVDVGTYDELILRGHDLRRSISAVEADKRRNDGSAADVDPDASNTVYKKSSVGTVDPPKLTRIARNTIRVVGGYEVPLNCSDNGMCHADPECQLAMENCPDYIADQVLPLSPPILDHEYIVPEEMEMANNTVDALAVHSMSSQGTTPSISETTPSSVGPAKKLMSADDSMSAGAVPFSTYMSYLKAVRQPLLILAMIASYLLANGAQFFQQYTVAKWTEVGHGSAVASALGAKYMRSLVNAAGVVSVFLWLRSFLTMQVGVRASEYFHSKMLASVFAAPMSFFDSTPSGQLLSRFGKEMETVDRGVPDSIGSVLFCFLQIFMSVAALAGVVTPGMLIPLALVGILYVKAMAIFRPAARDMKRSETKTRSPIYTHFGEALRGSETIRSIPGATSFWSSKHRELSDINLAVFHTVKSFDRWLSTRLETLGNTVVFTAAVASVFLTRAGKLKAGSAGWGLTQSLAITGLLTWAVRCLTDLETNMMSVMRVKELTDIDSEKVDVAATKLDKTVRRKMPRELSQAGEALVPLLPANSNFTVNLATPDSSALARTGWPWRGNVQFTNVAMRYNPTSPLVLDGVTLTVPAGSTLGVVGRTGSGKSSLLLTLFRLVDIEGGGLIEIDGVDIRSVDLTTLRQSLAIIPQDPVLFAGTVAYNLDATGKATEADMWKALESASPVLAQQFRNSEGLKTKITESGKNLSLGQRQLVCLARALLRQSKILVLDEATSSVDSKTDHEVQETIRREFVDKGVTVITVAHRLDTVLGYDKIAVLGDGKLIEYGAPNDLLRNPRGELRRLVEADRRNKRKGARQVTEPIVAV